MQTASGAKDLNPQQVEVNHLIAKKLSNVYKMWGYEEVSPPNIETLDTLMGGDAIASKDIIKLVSNNPLGLRPEMTTSIARAALTRLVNKPRPLRLWAKGTIFNRKEVPEAGTYIEEHLQSGVELFGIKSATAEIELLSLLLESLHSLELNESFKPTLLIGHTELMDLILEDIEDEKKSKIKSILINYDKVELNKLDIDSLNLSKIIDISQTRGKPKNVINKLNILYGNKTVINQLHELFDVIQPIADEYKVRIQLDPSFQPHYDLYNGLVFQLVCKSKTNQVVIAKGGRYDKIVERFSKNQIDVAGVGFSYAIDRTRELINEDSINMPTKRRILIAYKSNTLFQKALTIQRELHLKGKQALIELESRESKQEALEFLSARKCNELKWID